MAVFRINKTKNYTVMSNYHLRDKKLSLKTKGLLSMMLSLPDDWIYSVNGLVGMCKEGKKAIQSTLKELEDNCYLIREKTHDEKGRINYQYDIYETPQYPKGFTDKGCTDNKSLLNTNIQSNNNKDKIDKTIHHSLTLELVRKGFIKDTDINLTNYDNIFTELLKEYNYTQIITVINYIIRHYKLNNKLDEYGKVIENQYSYFKHSIYNNLELINQDIDLEY